MKISVKFTHFATYKSRLQLPVVWNCCNYFVIVYDILLILLKNSKLWRAVSLLFVSWSWSRFPCLNVVYISLVHNCLSVRLRTIPIYVRETVTEIIQTFFCYIMNFLFKAFIISSTNFSLKFWIVQLEVLCYQFSIAYRTAGTLGSFNLDVD
jgi:hypothetical protein